MKEQVIIIDSNPPTLSQYWQKLVQYRSLIWVFAWQEIAVLYKQTRLGFLWAVLRPLTILLIFSVLFKALLRVGTTSPYYLFAFTGMIAWNLFSNITSTASTAILNRQDLIRKMYFPKLILPLSKVLVAGVEFGISLLIIFGMMLLEGVQIHWGILMLPLFIFFDVCAGLAVAVWLSALTVRFRDLNQIIPPLIGMGIWLTPVFYPTTIIPLQYQFALWLNPMAGVIKGFRFALLNEPFPEMQFFISMLAMVVVAFLGIWYLIRVEDEMADTL
ncbi:MAG TPA: ABC transporter permease [Chitinophagales bacterium]